jgi:murein DD-endopeptidase MepM/ murein hydrolase activator NlpD
MDPYVRRVYLSVAGFLVLLWVGMFFRVIQVFKPNLLSIISAPSVPRTNPSQDLSPIIHIPEIHFSVYHTIKGDTFSIVAQKFNLLESTLRSLNQANDESQPQLDTPLLIPSKDGIFHIVRPGQGLAEIARAYGIPLRDVLKANQKRDDLDLQYGEILYLPGASYLSQKDPEWITLSSEAKSIFLKPTTGRFADGFGMRMHPITHKMAFHEGLDLAPGWGARVVASQDGRVIFASIRAGYGRLIILDHGRGLTSWYAHLDEILVKPQQMVKRGDLIGKVGNTGRTTGPHLHFEVRLNGKPQNPLLYLVQ